MANVTNYVSYRRVGGGAEDFVYTFVTTFTGSYVNGTGETINFLTAPNVNGLEASPGPPAVGTLPQGVPDFSDNVGGYGAVVGAYASGICNLKFQSAAGTELSSGAYPATITAGSIIWKVPARG